MYKLSFVIPCYGSEKTVAKVIEEIIETISQIDYDYEIITVNDCSPDNVIAVLKKLASENTKIKVINLAKNMGKHAAMMAGFGYSKGDFIIYLDDDGQCPVYELPKLVAAINNGYDVAVAQYDRKKQSVLKNLGSKLNNCMSSIMLKKPTHLKMSNFGILKKFIVDEILRYEHAFPYIDGLIFRATDNIAMIPMQDRKRFVGNTTFSLRKSISLLLNGFTAFSVKPLRIASVMGLIFSLIGFIFCIALIIRKILEPEIAAGYSSMMAVIIFTGGIIMCMLGLIGEYVGRIYISINSSPQYVVKEKINID